ncbi:DUF6232 family protein [Streptomyces sp. NPDC048717]|uniref:DUF6232 family protein n=1 Tax=unclassified Streptomyces TaxID=2593676 RepID=UPI003433FC53
MDLSISKRLLWVAGAAYPLHNIARVYTFLLRPRRAEAVRRFLKYAGLTFAAAIALTIIAGLSTFGRESDSSGMITFVWVVASAATLWFFADMLKVATAPVRYVLAVESNGQSTALVTAPDPATLDRLVGSIAHAIEHPETELQVRVERLVIGSPSNYYFGDTVNMYGGSGNVGMAA